MGQEFRVNDEVFHIPTRKECVVVATKKHPWKKENDVYGRREVYPTKDYLVLINQGISQKNGKKKYHGELDVEGIELKYP